jgi:hypothetical protein
MKRQRLLLRLTAGAVQNVRFNDFAEFVRGFGFRLPRIRGSHHIFGHQNFSEQLNLQNVQGEAKPYQIRQFLRLIERYNLTLEEKG